MKRRSAGGLCGVERKLSGINRELKEMGPQADEGGEQVLITDGVHTENTDDTEVHRRTLWGNVNHRNLNGI